MKKTISLPAEEAEEEEEEKPFSLRNLIN